jgi:two-component system chemotaxis response regulator CheB
MDGIDIVVVGASAGGVEALGSLIKALPADYHASVFVVLHISSSMSSELPAVLGNGSSLPVAFAVDQEEFRAGRVYIAPPDQHILVEPNLIRVVRGPKENRHRPAIDPLFRSAAWRFGPRVVGVVLTGYLDDGAAGLWAIKTCGGLTVVQDPADAQVPEMPNNALSVLDVDYMVPLKEIPPLLVRLAARRITEAPRAPEQIKREVDFAMMEGEVGDMNGLGTLSAYSCPSCRGPLWELRDGELVRFRCHTGHAFSVDSLLAEQSEAAEEALYSAIRALQEKVALSRRVAEGYAGRFPKLESQHLLRAERLERDLRILQKLVLGENDTARAIDQASPP